MISFPWTGQSRVTKREPSELYFGSTNSFWYSLWNEGAAVVWWWGGGLPIKSLFNKTGRGLNEAVRAAGRASLGEAAQGLVGSHMAVENPR